MADIDLAPANVKIAIEAVLREEDSTLSGADYECAWRYGRNDAIWAGVRNGIRSCADNVLHAR